MVWIPGIPQNERDWIPLGYPDSNPKPPGPKPFVDWIPEVSVAPRPPHCSLSLHCVVLESVIFHNIKARKSSLEALGIGAKS